jgi:hypothetical protein
MNHAFLLVATLLGSAITSLVAFTPGHAQSNPATAQPTKQFSDGFIKGCLQSKTVDVKNLAKYCTCMARSYETRYDVATLSAIAQLSGNVGPQGPALVNLMMAPEARACSNKS